MLPCLFFPMIFDDINGDITCVSKCWVGLWWAPEASGPPKEGRHDHSRDGSDGLFPTEFAVCELTRTYLSTLWSSITDVFHVDNKLSAVFGGGEALGRGGGSGNTHKCTAHILNLAVDLSAPINLYAIKTISVMLTM